MFRPGEDGPTYKVDEYEGVDKTISRILPKNEFDHYIYTNIPDNIINRTNFSVKLISDKNGNLVPEKKPDGTIEAFMNFEHSDEK